MKWTVLWKPDAERDLGELWMNADDKKAITNAANRIDISLRKDPLNVGESRADNDRIYFESPLGILYTVDTMDQMVFVERAWRFRSGKP
jgi:hypothetical protein